MYIYMAILTREHIVYAVNLFVQAYIFKWATIFKKILWISYLYDAIWINLHFNRWHSTKIIILLLIPFMDG